MRVRRNSEAQIRDLERRWRSNPTPTNARAYAIALLRADRLTVQLFAELGTVAADVIAERAPGLSRAIGSASLGGEGITGILANVFETRFFPDYHGHERCPLGHGPFIEDSSFRGRPPRSIRVWDSVGLEPTSWPIEDVSEEAAHFSSASEHFDEIGYDRARGPFVRCNAYLRPDGTAFDRYEDIASAFGVGRWIDAPRVPHCNAMWTIPGDRSQFE